MEAHTEAAEECRDGVDNKDSADQLPVGPSLSTTSYEDEPVLNQ